MLNYLTIPEFDKDFKKLTKRFRTLPNDFEIMKIPAFVLDRKFLTKLFVGEGSMLSVSAQDRRDIKRTIIQFPSVFKEPFTERFILTDFS